MIFYKMQGIGNDYIYFDCINNEELNNINMLVKNISDRNFGIGSDGVILLCNSEIADLKMKIFNKDGSEAQMCGNGIRCVAKLAYDLGIVKKEKMTIETLSGIKFAKLYLHNNKVCSIKVDMGIPKIIDNAKVKIEILDKNFTLNCISMGNPHAITFIKNINDFDVEKYGKIIEKDKHFKEKMNVEFVEIYNKSNIKMRVWERGTGETLACGTGACASVVAGCINRLITKKSNS